MPPREKTIKLADDVRDVLARSTIEGDNLKLPGQLDRELYQRVDKALKAAGGKWDRRAGAHVFDGPPRERLGFDTGEVVDRKQTFQVFETPVELAQRMVQLARMKNGDRVLEPSCGSGRLVAAASEAGGTVTAVEIREDIDAALLLLKGANPLYCGDFLELKPADVGTFDVVLMNPPFTRGQDIDHVSHALGFLAPGGRLVAVVSGGTPHAENRKATVFRQLVETFGGEFIPLPADTFKESGTSVSTALVVLGRPS